MLLLKVLLVNYQTVKNTDTILQNGSKAFIFFHSGYKESATDEKVPFIPGLVSTNNLFRNAVLLYGLILKTCKAEIV